MQIQDAGTAGASRDVAAGRELMRRMLRVRRFEERTQALAAAGEFPGVVHLYIGQEASGAGTCAALRDDDYITSTHRGHGHIVAKGGELARCMAELYGRETGYCRGKGGSMHIADMGLGIIGANGIVGAGIPIAVGAGLSAQMRGTDQVSVSFFGDGASNEGTFHESMNLAAIWKLPVIFLCENNGYGELSRTEDVTAFPEISRRADAYGIPSAKVDGNDAFAVYEAVSAAVARARAGEGPQFVETFTYRWRDHAEGLELAFPGNRPESEIDEWRTQRDPITRHRGVLVALGVDEAEIDALDTAITAEVEDAVSFAKASAPPPISEAFTDVWLEPVGGSA
jgi:acetoin:2,6-dichlorophenolindophenol oxidoreductase subunit alpha